ncbi:hypothetical protein [Actinomadura roseirufa]|uniref:hypothetical protein n=1 Tax=Actinomadura roseirufa TaxID=2094049 RepID=UPI001041A821|nr:hypothetical protein [Actinomadura roseirufa]
MSEALVAGTFSIPVDHGLIIVEDPASQADHDDWDPFCEFVSAKPDSVYLSVRPSVDGPVEVIIVKGEGGHDRASSRYFEGAIHAKGLYLVIRDADDVVRFSVRCGPGENLIRIMVDEPGLVSCMVVMFLGVA